MQQKIKMQRSTQMLENANTKIKFEYIDLQKQKKILNASALESDIIWSFTQMQVFKQVFEQQQHVHKKIVELE